jgi:hypothetical protein
MESAVCEILLRKGYAIEKKSVYPDDIITYNTVLVTNALIGAVPVLVFDGKKLPAPSSLWEKINREVL